MSVAASDKMRLKKLTDRLLSADVQVAEPGVVEDVPADLDPVAVAQVFIDHVPGVKTFLFRNTSSPSLRFLVSAYEDGLHAFRGTPVHSHLRSLLRIVVHHSRDGQVGAVEGLREVAEAFKDCQAVQARTIERVGLRLCGISLDFRGRVTALVGNYKALAIQMLALDRIARGYALDFDQTPTHYENRLTADLGQHLGLDADSVRLAALDGHASRRYEPLLGAEADRAASRCSEFFDVVALLQAFVAEANSFTSESAQDSIARLFLDWAAENLEDKHIIFDEATCSRTEISVQFALCVFEALFCGSIAASDGEFHRDVHMRSIFRCGVAPLKPTRSLKAKARRSETRYSPKKTTCLPEGDIKRYSEISVEVQSMRTVPASHGTRSAKANAARISAALALIADIAGAGGASTLLPHLLGRGGVA